MIESEFYEPYTEFYKPYKHLNKMNNQIAQIGDTVEILNDFDGHAFKIGQLVNIRERFENRAFGIVGNTFQYVCDGNYKIVNRKGLLQLRETNKLVPEKAWNQQIDESHFHSLREQVIQWGKDKGILVPENSHKQALKMVSEVGELCDALIKNDVEGIKDGIGDTLVTIIILSEQLGYNLTECLQLAYNEIKDRKGTNKDGIFIKE
jgi:NTP pyrophosphatase (non-canonical NTP hydrolase)